MPQDQVLAGITAILSDVTGTDRADITPQTPLADLGVDSLTMVEIVVAAEDRFGLLVNDDDWPRFKTVLDAIRYIEQAADVTLRPADQLDGPPADPRRVPRLVPEVAGPPQPGP